MAIDDLPAPPSGKVTVSSISDLPAPPPKSPSFPEKAEGFVYGLATSIPGMAGDIESMLPGGPDVGHRGKGELAGHETVFPTTQNVREMLSKSGFNPPPNPAVKNYITAGEVAPAVVAGGKGLYEGAKALLGAGRSLGESLSLGKTAKELAENLRSTGEKKAGSIAKKTGEEAATAQERASIAGKAEEKAGRAGESALKPLPGVTTTKEAGRFKPIAQTTQDIGTRIKDSANKMMENLRAKREANAVANKQKAFGDAFQKEAKGIQPIHKVDSAGNAILDAKGKPVESDSFKAAQKEIQAMIKNPVTGLTDVPGSQTEQVLKQFLHDINPRTVDPTTGIVMGKPASFEGLEMVRRKLSDRAFGFPETGFDAINQQQARRLAELVGNIQKEFSPSFSKFLSQYKADSAPLEVFQTKIGKALTDVQLPGSDFASVAAQDIPSRVFKSRENFNALVDAFGGNKQLANAEAKRYFASQLESKGTAKEVENFIRQNRAMLSETDSMKMAEKYAKDLRTYEKRAGTAKGVQESEEKIAQKKAQLSKDYQTFESDLAVAANDPAKITTASNNLAKRMLEHGQIDQNQYRELQRQIEKVRLTVRDAAEMKNQIKVFVYRALGYGALATAGGYSASKMFGD